VVTPPLREALDRYILALVTWMGGAYRFEHRRENSDARHEALSNSAAPPVSHPVLGLGGRSIELSLERGERPDPKAFELAVLELHSRLNSGNASTADLLDAARWLSELSDAAEPNSTVRQSLEQDLSRLEQAAS
jgi:hypothetical protein